MIVTSRTADDHPRAPRVTEADLKRRTRDVGVRVIRLVEALPKTRAADVIGRQLLRSATSIGANYRSACRGRSLSEFAARLAIAEDEADETLYWLELLVECRLVKQGRLDALIQELNELLAILVASIRTARRR